MSVDVQEVMVRENPTPFPLNVDVTTPLCIFADKVRYDVLPDNVLEQVSMLLFDYVAAAHGGYRINREFNKAIISILSRSSHGSSSIFLEQERRQPLEAAAVNAAYAHGADLDDGNKRAAGHVGTHVFSSTMALAEGRGISNRSFVEAIVVGYEIFCRLSAACMPDMVDRGFHSTGTVGAIASAGACAKLLGLGVDGIYSAIALAVSQASGLLVVGETGQEAKPLNAAKAAQAGVMAALLAEQGIVGPRKPLESAHGWLHAMASSIDIELILDGLGDRYFINECYTKPYPSCRHTHSAIEAALSLKDSVDSSQVKTIVVHTYGHAIELAGFTASPQTSAEAKFSIQYAIAVALTEGRFGLDELDVGKWPNEVWRLAKKVSFVRDDTYERPEEGIRGAKVVIQDFSGTELSKTIWAPRGEPENPFTWEDVVEKISACCIHEDCSRVSREEAEMFVQRYGTWLKQDSLPFVFPDIEKWGSL